jgi:hypothetical protein
VTDTNILRLSQPGTFTDALTEVLRLNGREPKHAAVTPLSAPRARRGDRVPCRAPRPSARGSRAASTGCSPVRPDARTMRRRSFRVRACSARHGTDRGSGTRCHRLSRNGGTAWRAVGAVRPCAFAVLRLITSSYFVGACTGRSAGFSPTRHARRACDLVISPDSGPAWGVLRAVIVDPQLLGAGARNLSQPNGSQTDRHRVVPEDKGRRPAHGRSRK